MQPSPGRAAPRVLPADARYSRLPRPDYEPHPYGVRPGAPAALAVTGGVLLASAPFGAWYRATRVATAGAPPEIVAERLGTSIGAGWLLAALGIALVVAGSRWARASTRWHVTATALAAAAVALSAAQFLSLQRLIDDGLAAAVGNPDFADLSVGAGWGAWAAAAGAGAALLAALLAVLARTERPAATRRAASHRPALEVSDETTA